LWLVIHLTFRGRMKALVKRSQRWTVSSDACELLSVAICRWCVPSISITAPILSLWHFIKKPHEYFHSCLVVFILVFSMHTHRSVMKPTEMECCGNKDEYVFPFFHGMWWSEVGYCRFLNNGVAKKGNISKGETFPFRRIYTLDIALMEQIDGHICMSEMLIEKLAYIFYLFIWAVTIQLKRREPKQQSLLALSPKFYTRQFLISQSFKGTKCKTTTKRQQISGHDWTTKRQQESGHGRSTQLSTQRRKHHTTCWTLM